jgi:hypothetical protein
MQGRARPLFVHVPNTELKLSDSVSTATGVAIATYLRV